MVLFVLSDARFPAFEVVGEGVAVEVKGVDGDGDGALDIDDDVGDRAAPFGEDAGLLEHKADSNIADNQGNSALHRVARCGDTKNLELLLEYGADVHATCDRGQTALMYATHDRHDEVVNILTNHIANVKEVKRYAKPTLIEAKSKKHIKTVENPPN